MTEQVFLWALNALFGIVVLGLGYWNSTMWSEIKELRRRAHDQQGEVFKLQTLVIGDYVKQADFRASVQTMTDAMTRGFDKIDAKMDDIYDELKHKVDKP